MSNWIDSVIEATKEAESPERFFYWASLAAISAVVRRNIWLNKKGLYKVYPNIYVLIMAPSGMRKGFPITVAKKLVEETDSTRIISGRNSIQAILKDLGKPFKLKKDEVIKSAQGLIISGEFSSLLVHDSAALTILTELYNTYEHEEEWKNTMKQAGVDRLIQPCLTLLGASNEEHFRDAVPAKDINGGFIGRASIVYEDKKRRVDSLLSVNGNEEEDIKIDYKNLSCYLKEISKLKGKFNLSQEAIDVYNLWYYGKNQDGFGYQRHNDKTGTMERLNDTILKIAMLISLANNLNMIINEANMIEAIDVCLNCTSGMKHVTLATGAAPNARATMLVLHALVNKPEGLLRKTLLSRGYGEYDSIDLDRIIETLQQSGAIDVMRQGKSDILYRMKKHALEMYVKYKKEVN